MHNRNLLNYAKMLFACSITLFFCGMCLDIYDHYKVIDPIKGVILSDKDNNTISITSVDNNKSKQDYFGYLKNYVVDDNIDALNQANENLKNEIQDEFSIKIMYGDKTDGYSVKTSDGVIYATALSNPALINSQLNRLKKTLMLYPKGIFKEIKKGGIPLTIILINNYSEINITGITDSNNSNAYISIAAIYPFEESFYHESYHYIERYMFKKGANFNSWDTLNPIGFSYGTIYSKYSYSNMFESDAFFVNDYAQVSSAEDRASTFEYMMADTKASCLNKGTTIWNKAVYMSRMIDTALNSASSNTMEYWERYLY